MLTGCRQSLPLGVDFLVRTGNQPFFDGKNREFPISSCIVLGQIRQQPLGVFQIFFMNINYIFVGEAYINS